MDRAVLSPNYNRLVYLAITRDFARAELLYVRTYFEQNK